MTTHWLIARRDDAGRAIELRRLSGGHLTFTPDGEPLAFVSGTDIFEPGDVLVIDRGAHRCEALAELDCYAVLGDNRAAALARWHEAHPDGPGTPEEYAEEQALRVGFRRRSEPA